MTSFIDSLQIAKPCNASWDDMKGDARVRHCGACKLNVYDLSSMTRADATALVQAKEGKLCIRMLKRADGTVITEDCVDRLSDARRAGVSTFAIALAFTGAMFAAACGVGAGQLGDDEISPEVGTEMRPLMGEAVMGAPVPVPEPELMMGKIAYVPTTTITE